MFRIGFVACALGICGVSACGGDDSSPDATPPPLPSELAADASEQVFPQTSVGATSDPLIVSVSNAGEGPTGAISTELTGAGGSAFAASGCAESLAAQESCELALTFSPDAGGVMEAVLTVTAENGGSVEIALQGEEAHNVAFVSSVGYPSNLGGYSAYDSKCNELATAAGLPNPDGNAYVAWISDSTSNVVDRLGTARGFVRVDGVPFADLIQANIVYNPLQIDENGQLAFEAGENDAVHTGTAADGTVDMDRHCENWTSNDSGSNRVGAAKGGPNYFTASAYGVCAVTKVYPIYCLQRTKDTPLDPLPIPDDAKLIYASPAWTPGDSTPDQRCESSRPAGHASIAVKALVSTQSVPAANHLHDDAVYVRVDGAVVGTGADIKENVTLRSHVWVDGAGNYIADTADSFAWTGASSPTETSDNPGTCGDWSDSGAGMGHVTTLHTTSRVWHTGGYRVSCAESHRLICVEQ